MFETTICAKIKIILFVFVLVLVSVPKTASMDVCTTPGCRKASSDVLSFIDPSVDPCEDFYKFTCGGIFKKTHEAKPASLEAMVKKEVDDQTTLMLIKPIDPSEPKAIQALKKFFGSCMDEAAIEKYGFSSIERALQLLEGWPVVQGPNWNENNFSLEELLVKLRRMGYNFVQMFNIRTTTGKENHSFVVDEPPLETVKEEDEESYLDYMVNIAVLLGADKEAAWSEMQETLLFKIKMLSILEKKDEFKKITIKCVQDEFPILNWANFINNIIYPNERVSEDEEIYFPSTEYLRNLQYLLQETSNRTLANYIIWEAVEAAELYLPKEFRDLKKQYRNSVSNGTIQEEENVSRLDFCRKEAQKALPPTFEALYVKEYFPPEKREKSQEIIKNIEKELLEMLNSTDLYDEELKSKMLEKANAVTYSIGAPDKVFDEHLLSQVFDENESLNTNDFLTIASILNRQSVNLALKLGAKTDFYDSCYEEILEVKATYSTYFNSIILPAATLQGLYFSDKRPWYLNFGTIGSALGYQLIHGFIQDGSNYDKTPYYGQLWTNSAKRNFVKRAECFIRQASNFKIEDSELHMNGKQVLEENICDYTGVEIAYRAYESWVNEHGEEKELPGLNYSPKQLFWISAASFFCDTISLDKLRDLIETERKPHPTFRTFNVLSNSENFGKDFNCSVGSRMNPLKKCKVF